MAFIALAVHIGRICSLIMKYIKLAKAQQCKKIELPARRGSILDRNGIKLAESLQVGVLFMQASTAKIQRHLTVAYHG